MSANASPQPDSPLSAVGPQVSTAKRVARAAPAWLISVVVHALLLMLFMAVTWVIVRPPAPDMTLAIGDSGRADGTGGGGAGGGRDNGASRQPNPGWPTVAPQPAGAPLPAAAALTTNLAAAPAPVSLGDLSGGTDPLSGMIQGLASGTTVGTGTPGAGSGGLRDGLGAGSGLGKYIDGLRGGMDVVLVLDATDSMSPYIAQAKKRLHQVINIVTGLVPNARFGMVAFKDYGDDYGPNACKWIKLDPDVSKLRKFLDDIVSGGGGDIPEPIHEALQVAISRKEMGWQAGRKPIIILISDAPVHSSGKAAAFSAARRFAKEMNGTINVIDVASTGQQAEKHTTVLPDLKQIATEGNGSAFLIQDGDRFWQHLIVSVFGERYRQDVESIIEKYAKE